MMVRFRNWNRLLLGPRSRDNYWDIQRRCEVWAFLLAILWWWGDMGWVRNRMAGPEIVKTLKYNFKRLTTKLWPTLTSHFFFQTSNSLRALISVGCCIHSMTCKYPLWGDDCDGLLSLPYSYFHQAVPCTQLWPGPAAKLTWLNIFLSLLLSFYCTECCKVFVSNLQIQPGAACWCLPIFCSWKYSFL